MTDVLGRLTSALADRYRIERELGQGGMATVYLAQDVRHDRKVALKVLRPELAAILGGERFLKEIRLTANLQHPHILPLHDSGEAEGIVYYVMPYVEGESLRDRITREKQLPVEDAVRIAREVADALDYAHRHGVVHRDIKPENILLHDGRAQVADFGIALAVSTAGGGTRMTETGMSLGTPHYMAPEQAMGEREISPKADVYALGCVLYEMLVGEPPFTGPTAQAIIARVMTEGVRSLTIQRRTIPPHVEAAVQVALEKLPADRFASAAEFGAALEAGGLAVGRYGGTATAGIRAPTAPPPYRRTALVVPWVLLLAALAAAVALWPRPAPPQVTRQRVIVRVTPFAPGGLGRVFAISPDGRSMVFVDTIGGTSQLWSKERDRLEASPLAGTTGAVGPVFSPDGEWIAFVADGKLKKVPRLGGSAVAIGDSANSTFPSIAWLDDDSVAFNNVQFSLLLVHQDGGPARVAYPVAARGVVSATALPGGRGVLIGACTQGCPDVELQVIDLRSGQVKSLSSEVIKGWHTSGGQVVFVRRDGGVFSVPFDLEGLAFRSAPVPVLDGVRTAAGRADLALSASGMLVYIAGAATTGGVPAEAMWVTREGVATQVEAGWTFVPTGNFGMALSPEGRRLALSVRASGSDDIWIKDLGSGVFTRLTFAGVNIRPEWTADGRTVMYVSRAAAGGTEDLHARRADGTGVVDTLLDVARTIFEVVRTRDTSQLIVRYGTPPTRDIYLFRLGQDSATRLLASDAQEEVAPALSPDGRWLAYVTNESGRNEVYVRPFPDVNGGRWQVSRNGGAEPRWSHQGRELFYRDGAGGLVSMPVTAAGSSLVLGTPRILFQAGRFNATGTHRLYDVTPDGRRFVFVRALVGPETGGPNHVIQVDNWLTELGSAARRRP